MCQGERLVANRTAKLAHDGDARVRSSCVWISKKKPSLKWETGVKLTPAEASRGEVLPGWLGDWLDTVVKEVSVDQLDQLDQLP